MIEITEYQARRIDLPPKDLRFLLDLVRGSEGDDEPRVLESITPTEVEGQYRLRPGPFVGRLGLPSGRTLDFQSRFDFEDVVELIRQSGKTPIRTDTLNAQESSERFLLDVIAEAFAREVRRLAGMGLVKGYRPRRFLRPPYPGRPDPAYHLNRLASRPDRLATVARRITIDTPLNRGIALALDVLGRVPLGARVAHDLTALTAVFMRVSRHPMTAEDVARVPLTNLTRHYQEARGLAEIILRSQSLAPREDTVGGASVLFNMARVWEGFVARWVQDQWPTRRVEANWGFDLTQGGGLRAEADVVAWEGDKIAALYDAKYKPSDEAPKRSDIYQMVTYCERLGLSEATLVYPEWTEPRRTHVTGKTVNIVGLSLKPHET